MTSQFRVIRAVRVNDEIVPGKNPGLGLSVEPFFIISSTLNSKNEKVGSIGILVLALLLQVLVHHTIAKKPERADDIQKFHNNMVQPMAK